MKLHLLALLLLSCVLASCADGPGVKITNVDGSTVHLHTGRSVMAKRENVVAEVEAPGGYHLRYMVGKEDATEVPKAFFNALVAKWLAGFTAHSNDVKTATDGQVAIGAQGVQKNKDTLAAQGGAFSEAVGKAPPESIKLGTAIPPGGSP